MEEVQLVIDIVQNVWLVMLTCAVMILDHKVPK